MNSLNLSSQSGIEHSYGLIVVCVALRVSGQATIDLVRDALKVSFVCQFIAAIGVPEPAGDIGSNLRSTDALRLFFE